MKYKYHIHIRVTNKYEDGSLKDLNHNYGLREGISEEDAVEYAKSKKAIEPGDVVTITLTKTSIVGVFTKRKRK
jgi:hypothetical protein